VWDFPSANVATPKERMQEMMSTREKIGLLWVIMSVGIAVKGGSDADLIIGFIGVIVGGLLFLWERK